MVRRRWIDERQLTVRGQRARVKGVGTNSEVAPRQPPVAPVAGPRFRSKWEAAYAAKLEQEKQAGGIDGWLYEPFSFKLAEGKRYRVDFVTWASSGVECIEVKGPHGKNRRDGLTHLHWAAQRFPFLIWRLVWRQNDGWNGRYIPS